MHVAMFSGLLIDSRYISSEFRDRFAFTIYASNQSTVEVPVLSWSRCMFESSYEINCWFDFSVHLACFALLYMYHQIETANSQPSPSNPPPRSKDASLRFSRVDDVAGVRRRLPAPAHG